MIAMCFSATASFSIAAVLVPVGAYSVTIAHRIDPKWVPIAIYPIAFAIQQAVEGVLWLGVSGGDQAVIASASRGFLFFSHFFWLFWVPFSVYWLETDPGRRKALLALTGIGGLCGLSVFVPSLLMADWLSIEVVKHSLEYKTVMIYDGIVNRTGLRAFYAAVVLSALFLSTDRRIRIFGALIAGSLLMTYLFFDHAFISVWCFFAAILSVCVLAVMMDERRRVAGHQHIAEQP